jgi:hypothetical protein
MLYKHWLTNATSQKSFKQIYSSPKIVVDLTLCSVNQTQHQSCLQGEIKELGEGTLSRSIHFLGLPQQRTTHWVAPTVKAHCLTVMEATNPGSMCGPILRAVRKNLFHACSLAYSGSLDF